MTDGIKEKLEALGNKFDSTMLADCITEQIIDNCDRVFGEDKTTQLLLEELDSERYEILKKKRAHNETLISKQEAPPTIG